MTVDRFLSIEHFKKCVKSAIKYGYKLPASGYYYCVNGEYFCWTGDTRSVIVGMEIKKL